MILTVYISAICIFTASFIYLKLASNIALIIAISRHALGVLNNKKLSDITKEEETRHAAIKLLKQAALIFLKSIIIITLTTTPLWLADTVGIATWHDTTTFSLRVDVLTYTVIIMSTAAFIYKAIRAKFHLRQ